MKLLLDTHIFLWYITGDMRVGQTPRVMIENADIVYLSVVSVWEATIKFQLGKLPLPEPPHPWLVIQREQHGFESLPVDEAAIAHLGTLPLHHRDPFDRLLICQAIQHDLPIVTVDSHFTAYSVQLVSPA